jgi:hypothetical protein
MKIACNSRTENLNEEDNFGDLGIGKKIILKWISKTWGGVSVDRIYLAQDRDQ